MWDPGAPRRTDHLQHLQDKVHLRLDIVELRCKIKELETTIIELKTTIERMRPGYELSLARNPPRTV